MITISVSSNARELANQVNLDAAEIRKATYRSLNRAADGLKTDASRKIRERYTITNKALSPAFYIRRATWYELAAVVSASGRPLPLIGFAARQVKRGVSVAVKKGGRKILAGSFIARMPSGHVGVFMRKGAKRLPIAEKFSVSVPGMFGAKEVQAVLADLVTDRFSKAMEQNLNFAVSRHG